MYKIINKYETNTSYNAITEIEQSSIKYIMNKAYQLGEDFRIMYLKGMSNLLETLRDRYVSYAKSLIPDFLNKENEVVNQDYAMEYSFYRESAYSVNNILKLIGRIGDFEIKKIIDLPTLFRLQVPDIFKEIEQTDAIKVMNKEKGKKKGRDKYVKNGIITGFRNLHAYTSVGINKLQTMANEGKLRDAGIEFMVGNVHKFYQDKVDKLLEENPTFFK